MHLSATSGKNQVDSSSIAFYLLLLFHCPMILGYTVGCWWKKRKQKEEKEKKKIRIKKGLSALSSQIPLGVFMDTLFFPS